MKKPKLTQWFPGHVKPVHKGVYMTQFSDKCPYSKWDGSRWMDSESTIEKADKAILIGYANKSWRGLAEKP